MLPGEADSHTLFSQCLDVLQLFHSSLLQEFDIHHLSLRVTIMEGPREVVQLTPLKLCNILYRKSHYQEAKKDEGGKVRRS